MHAIFTPSGARALLVAADPATSQWLRAQPEVERLWRSTAASGYLQVAGDYRTIVRLVRRMTEKGFNVEVQPLAA